MCFMYPGGKKTKTFVFVSFSCSYLWEENVISDMLSHNKEQKADVGLSLQIPLPPQLLFSRLQLHVFPLQSTRCWCAAAGIGAHSPIFSGSCCCLQDEKNL